MCVLTGTASNGCDPTIANACCPGTDVCGMTGTPACCSKGCDPDTATATDPVKNIKLNEFLMKNTTKNN